jgi:hypothetical protein
MVIPYDGTCILLLARGMGSIGGCGDQLILIQRLRWQFEKT